MGGWIRKLVPLLIIVLVAAALYVWRQPVLAWGTQTWASITGQTPQAASPTGVLIVSGMIEAPTVDIAAPVAGRIRTLHVVDGEGVKAAQPVAELDASLLDAQIASAEVAVQVARAQAAQARAEAREEDLAVARAAIGQAQANAAAARKVSEDAAKLVDAPATLDVEIARSQTALQVAEEQLNAATAGATAADLEQQLWGRIVQRLEAGFDVTLPPQLGGGSRHINPSADTISDARLQWNLKSQATWEAHAQQATATAARDAARQALADFRAEKAKPVALQGQAQSAEAAVPVADAAVAKAQADLALLEAGATAEQIAVADAAVARAEASRQVLEAKRPQYTVLAPQDGVVTEVVLHVGEVAAAGAPIVRQGQPGDVSLTVYVPEPDMARVRLGGPVAATVDAFPGRTFTGAVTDIASEVEFTPKNVQTRDDRSRTVFAVKVSLPNVDGSLKAGMTADAFICPGTSPCEFPFEAAAQENSTPLTELAGRILPRDAPAPVAATPQSPAASYAGALEATTVRVASEVGGRALTVAAGEGDRVSAGQVLVRVEGEDLAAQRAEADAAVAAAQADLARVDAKPQLERVAQAEAAVRQAEAAVGAAEARLSTAWAQLDQPQELDRQINTARQQIAAAVAAVDAARAQLKSAQVLRDSLQNPGSDEDKTRAALYAAQTTAAEASVRAAEAQQAGAKSVLARLQAIRSNPVALTAAVHKAEGDVAIARAAVETARAALDQVQAAPQAEAIAVARARVDHAVAGRAAIDVALARLEVRSPIAGEVSSQAIHPGEVVTPGSSLLTIADLSHLRLPVYVPLPRLGDVRLGQPVQVTVDAFPGRVFEGRVTKLADKAEYTPKNVQTADERARMVLQVEMTLDNSDGSLRPGMGAEARFH